MPKISAKRTIITSFVVDLGDIILNVIIMIITGSVVLLAEALEGGSDLIASGLLLIGLNMSKKRANKKHPFGYGKALFSWTMISAIIMLAFGAGLSFYFGLKRFLQPEEISHIGLVYGALLISVATNGYALSISTRRLLNKEKFSSLKKIFFKTTHVETKNTFILDFTGTSAAIVGLISITLYQIFGILQFDGIGGMLMGLTIAVSSIVLIWGVKDYLIGKPAPPEIEKQITEVVFSIPEVKNILELHTMYIGSEKLLVHLDINLENKISINEAAKIIELLKSRLKKTVPVIKNIQVEIK